MSKKIYTSTILFFCALLLISFSSFSQKKELKYEVGTSAQISSKSTLPFWLVSNKDGLIPSQNSIFGDVSLGMGFNEASKTGIDFMWKASAAGYTGDESKLLLDQLYTGFKWKFIDLYIGQKNTQTLYGGLSSTNGNLLYSNNARSYPRYEISVSDWTNIPFTKGILSFKALLSDGITTDNRYIDKARIHHKNIYVRILKDSKFSASAGVEHYALWAGTHPTEGKISGSFDKYKKVFMYEGDDEGAFGNDSYRLGNHLGSFRFDLYYNNKNFSLNSYFQTIFEDGSGRDFGNSPDGLYGLFYTKKNNDKNIIQSAILEFYHTTDQSGRNRLNGDDGNDNYLNHGEYKTGWTHHGRTMGSPLFITNDSDNQPIINNRFKAIHLGVKGFVLNIPYRAYFTYSKNYGTNDNPFSSSLNQYSSYLEVNVPVRNIPFKIDLACALDQGELLGDNVGFMLRLSKSGIISSSNYSKSKKSNQ